MGASKYNQVEATLKEWITKERGYARAFDHENVTCVYLVGPRDAGPVKVGLAKDLKSRLGSIQTSNWTEIFILGVAWFRGRKLAARTESEAHRILDKDSKRIRGEWFDVDAGRAMNAIEIAANNLKIETYTDEQMAKLLIQYVAEDRRRILEAAKNI